MGFTFHKAGQGRYARMVTAMAIGVILIFGCWELYQGLSGGEEGGAIFTIGQFRVTWHVAAVSVVFAGGLSIIAILTYGYQSTFPGLEGIGNRGRSFIDFLIDVEAELRKVAWPNRRDLVNSTWVVIVTMIVFALFLVFMDRVLQIAMRGMGVW